MAQVIEDALFVVPRAQDQVLDGVSETFNKKSLLPCFQLPGAYFWSPSTLVGFCYGLRQFDGNEMILRLSAAALGAHPRKWLL